MDPSALIFVALAVAWAAYLVPQAFQHHAEVQRSRSVERFSHRMRVLARREPTSSRDARLVVTPGRAPSRPVIETKGPAPVVATVAARRAAANRAARRRRTVLSVILLGLTVVTALALGGLFSPWWIAAPGGLLVAWLVACRLMVKSERRTAIRTPRRTGAAPVAAADADATQADLPAVDAESVDLPPVDPATPVVAMPVALNDPSRWDMVPVTLPTYVSKPAAARRSVQTIDLESTGVWTSGRTEVDAELARTAEADRKAEAARADAREQRATGS